MADHPEFRRPLPTGVQPDARILPGPDVRGNFAGIRAGYGEDYRRKSTCLCQPPFAVRSTHARTKVFDLRDGGPRPSALCRLYTDYYGTMEYMGGGELSSDERREVRQTLWKQATGRGNEERSSR